ncbi:MAG: MFS transporter [Pirellulales bacterium]
MDSPAENPYESPEAPLDSSVFPPYAPPSGPSLPQPTAASIKHDAYGALRIPAFRRYVSGNVLSLIGMQMQTTAVGWEVYELTGSAMSLAMVGLAQVVPVMALSLVTGHVADRFSRRLVICMAVATVATVSVALAINSHYWHSVQAMYGLLLLNGVARAFQQPAKASYMPTLVPRVMFPNAVTWTTSGFQLATVLGPAAAGATIAAVGGAAIVYAINAGATFVFVVLLMSIPRSTSPRQIEPFTWRSLAAGVGFLRRKPIVLGAILLDMFAVLLGGATAMLPIFAKDILEVGPSGLGWLRAAPAVGALITAMIIAHRPPMERAGRAMLISVFGFGLATIGFGFSTSFAFSLAMMFTIGVMDNVSVIVRHTLVQVLTPDAMRGRVSAINGMFISMSNELGEVESGVVATFFGPVIAVVTGGVGTLLVVAIAAYAWPDLRRYGRLGDGGDIDGGDETETAA